MDDPSDANVDLVDDEFERLGRRAGAELRLSPPTDGPRTVLRTAHRRRATASVIAAGATVAIVVTALFVVNSRPQREPAPAATVPPAPTPAVVTTAPVVATTAPPDSEDAQPPDAVPTTTPGTWRTLAESPLAPGMPTAAVWTGTEAIVIGWNPVNGSEPLPALSAVAYHVGQDRWRSLADPPTTLAPGLPLLAQWTGSEVLATTPQGEVYAYDPLQDRWEPRAAADESMALPATDALVAVSATGVLARSSKGWWWYESATDRWEPVPALADGGEYSTLEALDRDRIVATWTDGVTITSAVFDIASRSWRTGPPVEDTPFSESQRDPTVCAAHDGLLVCYAEGFMSLRGVVIDPLVGVLNTFELGPHDNPFTLRGLPWMTHASKLLSPRTATWEDLPPSSFDEAADSLTAAIWTGSEIVFFRGANSATGESLGLTAAYTPLQLPGQ